MEYLSTFTRRKHITRAKWLCQPQTWAQRINDLDTLKGPDIYYCSIPICCTTRQWTKLRYVRGRTHLISFSTSLQIYPWGCFPPMQNGAVNGDALRLIILYRCRDKHVSTRMIINYAAEDIAELREKAISDRISVPIITQNAIELRLRRIFSWRQEYYPVPILRLIGF